ncbi:unnamed protein product [Aureobasidium vineae]|uniref:Uncharacterized protein n=1 Tax=Aureobasidium vineae TaxID=2773715 RepID=A0A9N8JLM9_9PEZI|nr:unnamed protein product [Aureobasidium vineae]
MSVDIDTFLRQNESAYDAGYSHDMDDSSHNRLEMDDFKIHDDYNDTLGLDVFGSNNVNSGHGILSFSNNIAQQPFIAPSNIDGYMSLQNTDNGHEYQTFAAPFDVDGHATAQKLQYGNDYHGYAASSGPGGRSFHQSSQHGHEQQQLAAPSDFNGHACNQRAQQGRDTSVVLANDEAEDVADSIEHDNANEEEVAEDEVPPKNEERDSDQEFAEEDEEGADEDEDEDGNGKDKKQKRKPYSRSRMLIRWNSKSGMGSPQLTAH